MNILVINGSPKGENSITLQTLLYLRRRGVRGWLYDRNFLWTVLENESLTVDSSSSCDSVPCVSFLPFFTVLMKSVQVMSNTL